MLTAIMIVCFLLVKLAMPMSGSLNDRFAGAEGWCLNIDSPVVYLSKFSVPDGSERVHMRIWQEQAANPVRYSIVKRKGFGSPAYFASFTVADNYPRSGPAFEHSFADIPPGSGYEIEVYNYGGSLCYGQVNVDVCPHMDNDMD